VRYLYRGVIREKGILACENGRVNGESQPLQGEIFVGIRAPRSLGLAKAIFYPPHSATIPGSSNKGFRSSLATLGRSNLIR
jgi:hypothetical protein